MRRRAFITLLGGIAVAWPSSVQAQQAAPRVGWIGVDTPEGRAYFEALREGMRELGLAEGRTFILEPRWVDDDLQRVPEAVSELAASKVQVLVVMGAVIPVLRRVIDATPVVFCFAPDPLAAKLVESLNRPAGNYTGTTLMFHELNGKRLELLREAFPRIAHVAVLSNPRHPGEDREVELSDEAANRLALKLTHAPIVAAADVDPALQRIRLAGAEAIMVLPSATTFRYRQRIIDFALERRIPAISGWAEFAHSGGVLTYGPNVRAAYRRLAVFVDKILKGARPADLPVEQPTRFELVINLKAAKALGIAIPPTLLARADEVIE